MIAAHNTIVSQRANQDYETIKRYFLNQNIVTVTEGNAVYTVNNLLGFQCNIGTSAIEYQNWLNACFEGIFSPAVLRNLAQRPSLRRVTITASQFATASAVNPYHYALGYTEDNLMELEHVMQETQMFFKNTEKITTTLTSLIQEASGSKDHE